MKNFIFLVRPQQEPTSSFEKGEDGKIKEVVSEPDPTIFDIYPQIETSVKNEDGTGLRSVINNAKDSENLSEGEYEFIQTLLRDCYIPE